METKRHPTFHRNLLIGIVLAMVVSICLFLNSYFLEDRNFLAGGLGIVWMGAIIFSAVIHGLWAGSHVKCPDCGTLSEKVPDELNKNRKVLCKKCNILWIIGVSYHVDAGGK